MLEDAEFSIDCPNCNKKITVRADQVGKSVACPHCKETIELKDNGFTKNLHNAENQINHLFDDFLK
jgi:predicted Zn finger-like uncharacterized protein